MPPRAPLSPGRVVDAAAAIADREGLGAVSLARVASEVGVRTPSLYNHVEGLPGLHRALTLRALHELGRRLQRATVGRSGDDAVRALASAYRDFARERPGLYAATLPSSEVPDADIRDAGHEVVATVTAVLGGYGFDDDAGIHATRTLRSLLHGFTTLELAGGFGLAVDTGETFDWLLRLLTTGLAELAATPTPTGGGSVTASS